MPDFANKDSGDRLETGEDLRHQYGIGGRPLVAGKRVRTERLPATGLPLVDKGPLCEQPGMEEHAGCTLDERERMWLVQTLHVNAQVASNNQRDAIQDSRIDKLTASGPGWGFLEEFIFMSLTGMLIGPAAAGAQAMLRRGAARLAETPYDSLTLKLANVSAIDVASYRAVVANASRGLRSELKHRRLALPPGQIGKAAFLQVIRQGIGPMTRRLVTELPTAVDDATLIAITLALGDDSLHGVPVYAEKLAEVCASFDENQLDDVGRKKLEGEGPAFEVNENQRGRLVWVANGKERRLAMFAGRSGNDLVRLIDPQWHALAVELYRGRAGREPDEMAMDGLDSSLEAGAAIEDRGLLDSLLGAS